MWQCKTGYPPRIWDDERDFELTDEASKHVLTFRIMRKGQEYIGFNAYNKIGEKIGGTLRKEGRICVWYVWAEWGAEHDIGIRREIIEESLDAYRAVWGKPSLGEDKYFEVQIVFDAERYVPNY